MPLHLKSATEASVWKENSLCENVARARLVVICELRMPYMGMPDPCPEAGPGRRGQG